MSQSIYCRSCVKLKHNNFAAITADFASTFDESVRYICRLKTTRSRDLRPDITLLLDRDLMEIDRIGSNTELKEVVSKVCNSITPPCYVRTLYDGNMTSPVSLKTATDVTCQSQVRRTVRLSLVPFRPLNGVEWD
jgi:hypothetical protein